MKTAAVPSTPSFRRRGRPFSAACPQSRDRATGWRRGILAASIAVLLVLETGAGAATSTWNGGSAVDSNFTSVANWTVAPASNNDFVFAGTLRLAANNDLAALTMNTLTFAPGAGAFTLTGNAILLTAGLANNSSNLQTVSFGDVGVRLLGAQTWTANTAALEVAGGLNSISAVNLNGFTLTIAGAQNTTIRGIVSGAGGLIKDGTGTLEFTGTEENSYSGTTTVNDGTLSLNGAGTFSKIGGDLVIGDNLGGANSAVVVAKIYSQIADQSNVTINSDGQYDVGGEGDTINNLVIDRGTVVGVPTNGFGSLELNGSLTMTGGSISGGTGANFGVELLGGAGISDVTATSDAAGNAATINSNLTLSGGTTSRVRTFTVNAGPGAVDLVVNGVIQNGNNDGIIKAGTGTLELTRNNTYTGGTDITGGTLLANNVAGSATGSGPVNVSSGTLGGSGFVSGNVNLNAGGVLAPGAAATGIATASTGISTATFTLGSLTWQGGTLDLQLGASNATSDLLAITGSMTKGAAGAFGIDIGDAGGFGAQPTYTLITFGTTNFAAPSDFTLDSLPAGYSGTLVLGANALTLQLQTVGQTFWKGDQGTVWTTNAAGNTNWATDLAGLTDSGIPGATADVTFSATGAANQNTTLGADITIKSLRIIDPANVSIGGPNKLTINNTAAQAITVFSGAGLLTISANLELAGAANTLTVNNTAGALISGIITGSNGLIKRGTGTLKLTGDNNYTGLTSVRDGTLQLQGPATNTMIKDTVVVGDGVGTANTAVLELLAGLQIADTVGVTVNSDGKFIAGGEGIGALTVNGGTVDTGSGGGLDAASLDMTGGSVIGTARLGLNGGVTTHAADTTATISAQVTTLFGASQTFTVEDGAAATDLRIVSAILSSPGNTALIKEGAGTLELTAPSFFSGGTTINGGTLLANNATLSATGSGAVAVNAGATLGGSGTLIGPVTLNTGAFIAPGAAATGISTATLTLGSLTWQGGTLNLQLGATDATSDLLAITGSMTKNAAGTFAINITDAGGFGAQQTYTLITFANTTFTSPSDFTLSPLPAGISSTLVLGTNDLKLQLQILTQAFWKGDADNLWTTNAGNTNWATDIGGLTDAGGIPGALTAVTFSATSAANQNTTLGANFTIKSLTVNDPAAVTIGGANKLTINNTAAQAITVNSGAGLLTISASLELAGAASTVTVNNAAGALISGVITGNNGLIKDGTGALTLTGNNNYLGTTQVKDGMLLVQGTGFNTTIRGAVVVGDGVGAADSAVLQLLNPDRIANIVGVTVNRDGKFISFDEIIGALTVNGGTVDTGSGPLGVSPLDMTGGSVIGATNLVLQGDVTTHAAATTATISSPVLLTAPRTFNVAAGAAATDLLVSGPVSGAMGAGIIKAGPGTLELTNGTGIFSGGMTINGGTVLANNVGGSATGSGPVLVNAGTLGGTGSATGPVFLNAGGAIAPGMVATGISTGTLTLGSLTWQGGTISLHLGATTATSDLLAITGSMTKEGAGTFGIKIADAGGFGALATYTLVTFASTTFAVGDFTLSPLPAGYTGRLVLDADSLDLKVTAFTASGPLLQNSAPVNLPTFADYIISGETRTGKPHEDNTIKSLTFQPGGSLTINNKLTVTEGPVDLVGGSSIHLNGTLSTSQLNVHPGAALTGNGAIERDLFNAGLVSPGNSPGRVLVAGDYTQFPGGTLRIEVGGRNAGQFDVLSVGARANLGGTLQLVRLANFELKRGDQITFLTAEQGVLGEFAQVINPFTSETILQPEVVYHQRSVALEMVRQSFAGIRFSLTPNQRAVAAALDSLSAHDPDHKALVYLDERKLHKLPADFDLIAPDELTSIFTISTSLANVQSTNLQRRTDDIRHGSTGFSANGLAIQGTGPGYSGTIALYAGKAGATGDSKEMKQVQEAPVPPADRKWGAFLTGTGEWVDVDGDGNGSGYDITTGGFTLGLDYKVNPNFAIGLSAGYVGTAADLTNDGRVWVNGGKLGVYATAFTGGWYADVAVTGGLNSYDTKRSALQGTARGSTSGGELNVLAGTGYDWKIGALQIGPTATFQYTLVGIDGFTEDGSLSPLDIAGQDVESTRSALGFKASFDWKAGSVLIRPELRASWQHEYGDTAYAFRSTFATGSNHSFVVHGPDTGRDSLLLGAGVAIQCSERCATYLYYDGELGRTNYETHSVSGGVRLAF